jgi:inner membrane transporter RhtA
VGGGGHRTRRADVPLGIDGPVPERAPGRGPAGGAAAGTDRANGTAPSTDQAGAAAASTDRAGGTAAGTGRAGGTARRAGQEGRPARRAGPAAVLASVPASALVFTGIVSVQVGAGFAARLFTEIPPAAVTGLRLWTAAALMAVAGARALRESLAGLVRRRSWRDAAVAVAFGLTLAVMNFSIYQAFDRIPLGIAVTVEFLGPLAVAIASSRRLIDLLWVGLAGTGVALLTRAGAAAGGGHHVDLVGFAFALLAGASWAGYIVLSRATGRRFPGTSGLTIAMLVAAIVIIPVGVTAGRGALLRPGILATGLGIGLLSSIIPYSLELEALRRVPARVFGIWMSLEPAVAALVGLVMLSQALTALQWAAIVCVMIACAGAARGSARPSQAPQA